MPTILFSIPLSICDYSQLSSALQPTGLTDSPNLDAESTCMYARDEHERVIPLKSKDAPLNSVPNRLEYARRLGLHPERTGDFAWEYLDLLSEFVEVIRILACGIQMDGDCLSNRAEEELEQGRPTVYIPGRTSKNLSIMALFCSIGTSDDCDKGMRISKKSTWRYMNVWYRDT